jgi:hypothetical protein
MIILIILSIISLILTLYCNPTNIVSWVSIITTFTFILRPIGVHVKVNKIIPIELLITFLAFNGSLMLKTFSLKTYIFMMLCRGLFYLIVLYDDKSYIYIQETEEREL